MSAYLYRVSKERCKQKCKMELAAFLGGADDAAHPFMGGEMVSKPFADSV